MPKGGPNGFRDLCQILTRSCDWLGDELYAELRVEQGKLQVDDHIMHEAGILVQRRYGHSLKLTAEEKKGFQVAVALRTQCAKEVWKRRLEEAERDLKVQREINQHKEEKVKAVLENLETFRRLNARTSFPDPSKVESESGDTSNPSTRPTSEATSIEDGATRSEPTTVEDKLRLEVDEVQNLILTALSEKERLTMEKAKAFNILKVNDQTASLDAELQALLDKLRDEINNMKVNTAEDDKRADELNSRLRRMELKVDKQTEGYDKVIRKLQGELSSDRAYIRDMYKDIRSLEAEARVCQSDQEKYRIKAQLLDKHRRLGFITDRWDDDGKSSVELPAGIQPRKVKAVGRNAGESKNKTRKKTRSEKT